MLTMLKFGHWYCDALVTAAAMPSVSDGTICHMENTTAISAMNTSAEGNTFSLNLYPYSVLSVPFIVHVITITLYMCCVRALLNNYCV